MACQPSARVDFQNGRGAATIAALLGGVAQLGERNVRNVEAVGSIPSTSTKKHKGRLHASLFYIQAEPFSPDPARTPGSASRSFRPASKRPCQASSSSASHSMKI